MCFTVANYPVTVKLRCCFLATKYLHQVSRDPHCSLMKTFFWLNLELWCGKILDGNLNYTAISENDNIDPSLQRRAVARQFLSISINTFFWNSYSTTQKMTCLESQEFLRLFFPSLPFTFLCCRESQFMSGRVVGNGATPKLSLSKVMIHESTKINIRRFCCSALKYYPRLSVTLCLARHER